MSTVPLPPFDRVVYPPSHEPARRFLTGGLPAPHRKPDGWDRCTACDGKVRVQVVATHVEGSTPVRVLEDHICYTKAIT